MLWVSNFVVITNETTDCVCPLASCKYRC